MQSWSPLDPLFNRKIFAVVCLILTVSFTTYIAFSSRGLPPDRAPESVEVSPNKSPLRPETAYEQGFRNGYSSFLAQTGKYIPQPNVTASYASSYSSDDEDVQKGYVDGYHRATEVESCPRGCYE